LSGASRAHNGFARQRTPFDSRTTISKTKPAIENAPTNGLLDDTLLQVGSGYSEFMNNTANFSKRPDSTHHMFPQINTHFLLDAQM